MQRAMALMAKEATMTPQEQALQLKAFQKTLRSHHAGSPAWLEVIDRCVDVMLTLHIEQLETEVTGHLDPAQVWPS